MVREDGAAEEAAVPDFFLKIPGEGDDFGVSFFSKTGES